jgi:hypothetical protein
MKRKGRMMSNMMFVSYTAAALALFNMGYGCSAEAVFVKAEAKVKVVKSASGYWVAKEVK